MKQFRYLAAAAAFTGILLLQSVAVLGAESIPSAVFNAQQPSKTRMNVWAGESKNLPKTAAQGGKTGWLAEISNNDSAKRIYCDVDNSYLFNAADGAAVEVAVEYFDAAGGLFDIAYDSVNSSYGTEAHVTSTEYPVELGGSNTWKTHVFRFYDVRFADQLSGADFVIRTYGANEYYNYYYNAADVLFGSVTVRRIPIVATLDTGFAGNIFDSTGSHTVAAYLENTTDETVVTSVTYTATSLQTNGDIWNSNQIVTLFPHQISQKLMAIPCDSYGLYNLSVETDASGSVPATQRSFPYSAAVKNDSTIRDDRFGVCVHPWEPFWGGVYTDTLSQMVANGGNGWVRADLQWSLCETDAGEVKIPDYIMKAIDATTEKGIGILMPLHGANKLYSGAAAIPFDAGGLSAFENYCYRIALELKGKVDTFETWNEYNLAGAQTVSNYMDILKATYNGVKRGNPDAVVVGFNAAGTPTEWMTAIARQGGLNYMDAISVHPYSSAGDPDPDTADLPGRMRAVKDIVDNYGSGQEIWISEIGWSNTRNRYNTGSFTEDYSALQSAVYTVKSYVHCIGQSLADRVLFYDFMNDFYHSAVKEANFGMIESRYAEETVPYAAKPAYAAASFMTHMLYDAKPTEYSDANGMFKYRFTKSSGCGVDVIWSCSDSGAANLALPENGTTVIYDIYGNVLKTLDNTAQAEYRQTLGETPIYAEYLPAEISAEPVFNYTVNEQENNVTVSAQLPEAKSGAMVSLHVMRAEKQFKDIDSAPLESVAFASQGSTDKNGYFSDTFQLPDKKGLYTAYAAIEGYPERYELDVAAGEGFMAVLSAVQNGKSVSALNQIDGAQPMTVQAKGYRCDGAPMKVFCAFYSGGKLAGLQSMDIQTDETSFKQQLTLTAPLNGGQGFDGVKLFLWNPETLVSFTKSVLID